MNKELSIKKTMTVKEISEFTGKNKSTIGRWILKADNGLIYSKLQNATQYNPARFTIDEVELILKSGSLSKDAVSILMENARKPQDIQAELISNKSESDIIMSKSFAVMADAFNRLTEITKSQENRLCKIEDKIEERKALLPAPSISPRQNVSKIVREYSINKNLGFKEAYNMLYTDFGYRTHMNVSQRANNRSMAKMDYIEAEGMIETLEAVAIDTMGLK